MSDVLDLESAIVRQAIAFGLDVSIKSTVPGDQGLWG